jgi:hypothetical protein
MTRTGADRSEVSTVDVAWQRVCVVVVEQQKQRLTVDAPAVVAPSERLAPVRVIRVSQFVRNVR